MKTAVLFATLSALASAAPALPSDVATLSAVSIGSLSGAASIAISQEIVAAPAGAFNASVGPGGGLPGAPQLDSDTVAKAKEGAKTATSKLVAAHPAVHAANGTRVAVAPSVPGKLASGGGGSGSLAGALLRPGSLSDILRSMGSSPTEVVRVTASHLFGLTPGLFDGILSDLLKPWFTDGKKEKLSDEEVQEWRPLAELVAASYCPLDRVHDLTCGPACDDIKTRNVTWVGGGGDNQSNPQWFIVDDGHRLILSLQGTNFASILSWANDIDLFPLVPQEAHFPETNGAKIHRGFYSAFTRQIDDIEAALAPHLETRKEIVITGHSQGAALGEIHTTYLIQKYPNHNITGRMFAKPRVGDRTWADYVDSVTEGKFEFMQNNADLVGLLPPIEWAFRHPSGEVWIDGTEYYKCEGQENQNCIDSQRIIGWIPNVVIPIGELQAHIGPYIGVQMGLCGIY